MMGYDRMVAPSSFHKLSIPLFVFVVSKTTAPRANTLPGAAPGAAWGCPRGSPWGSPTFSGAAPGAAPGRSWRYEYFWYDHSVNSTKLCRLTVQRLCFLM